MRDPKRVRVRQARKTGLLACRHWAYAGSTQIVSVNRGAWICEPCYNAPLKIAGQAKRRGMASVPEILADEQRRE